MKNILVGFLLFIVSISVIAHTLQSQDGINVSHHHLSSCYDGCPDDSIIENMLGFNRSDRKDAGTWEYNCHGRTFDNSNSWVNHSDAWIFGYGNQSVYPPIPGDVVVWYSGNGTTSTTITEHTATIISSWNGNNTIVSSKYGKHGKYEHELFNTIAAYGTNYSFVRLNTANVYKSISTSELDSKETLNLKLMNDKISFSNKNRKNISFEERFIKLENSKYIKSVSLEKRIDLLISDLVKTERDAFMGLYSTPELTSNYVSMIKSGNMLIEIAMENIELSQKIGDRLKEIVVSPSMNSIRGIAMYFLSKLEKETGFYWDIHTLYPEIVENPKPMSYFDYYLIKSMN